MADKLEQDRAIAQFSTITGTTPAEARELLELNSWKLDAAVAEYYTSHEDDAQDQDYEPEDEDEDYAPPAPSQTQPQASSGIGRRLGDGPTNSQPIPVASSSSQPTKIPKTQKKFATLGDFGSTGDDEDEAEPDEKQNLFAGGEKSGLAVQNPDDVKKKIIEKAMKKGKPPKVDDQPRTTHFRGPAQTLGGDDAPSRTIAPPPQAVQGPQSVERILHFWNDGFSVDDGDLYRTDDPRNAEILNGIRQGRAPLSIMNLQPGQEVDVEIKPHDENYSKPKPKYKPFGGSGNRLGSPTPGAPQMPGSFEPVGTSTTAVTTTALPKAEVDETQPIITMRVTLGSGTRMTARFNTTHTIGDVYAFVSRAETTSRDFVLQTTFPTKEFKDHSQILADIPEFKRGGAIIQKYI